jgi:hypothetical protein
MNWPQAESNMNLRFAVACFFILFGLAQFWGWLQQFSWQKPVILVGALLLAFISNFDKTAAFPFTGLHQWLNRRNAIASNPTQPMSATSPTSTSTAATSVTAAPVKE